MDSWFLGIDCTVAGVAKEELEALPNLLRYCLLIERLDKLVWHDGIEIFSIRICYQKILQFRHLYFNEGVFNFNWKIVWLNRVPSNVNFLVWLIVRRRVLTQANLQSRGYRSAGRCTLCFTCS